MFIVLIFVVSLQKLKEKRMTPQKETEVRIRFSDFGSITITVVPFDGTDPFDKTYSNNEDEAISEILGWETSADVYV